MLTKASAMMRHSLLRSCMEHDISNYTRWMIAFIMGNTQEAEKDQRAAELLNLIQELKGQALLEALKDYPEYPSEQQLKVVGIL